MNHLSESRKSLVRDGYAEADIWGEGGLVTAFGALDAPESIPGGAWRKDFIQNKSYQVSVSRPRVFD